MGFVSRMTNVGIRETMFRFVIGAVLIASAFFILKLTGLLLGVIGVIFILTAIFGY